MHEGKKTGGGWSQRLKNALGLSNLIADEIPEYRRERGELLKFF